MPFHVEALALFALILSAWMNTAPKADLDQPPPPAVDGTCANVLDEPADAGPIDPSPKLTFKKKVPIEIHFTRKYGREDTRQWSDVEKQYICSAARRVEAVWSSTEFYNALISVKKLKLRGWTSITGADLYDKLTTVPFVLNIAVSSSPDDAGQCGATIPRLFETVVPTDYIGRHPGAKACDDDQRGTALVRDLADTIAHEWTHYANSVRSEDAHAYDDPHYVSYGVGCMTENLAVTGDDCSFDPSRTQTKY